MPTVHTLRLPHFAVTDLDTLSCLPSSHAIIAVDSEKQAPRRSQPSLVLEISDADYGPNAPGIPHAVALFAFLDRIPTSAHVIFSSPARASRAPTLAYIALCRRLPARTAIAYVNTLCPGFLPISGLCAAADHLLKTGSQIADTAETQYQRAMFEATAELAAKSVRFLHRGIANADAKG